MMFALLSRGGREGVGVGRPPCAPRPRARPSHGYCGRDRLSEKSLVAVGDLLLVLLLRSRDFACHESMHFFEFFRVGEHELRAPLILRGEPPQELAEVGHACRLRPVGEYPVV